MEPETIAITLLIICLVVGILFWGQCHCRQESALRELRRALYKAQIEGSKASGNLEGAEIALSNTQHELRKAKGSSQEEIQEAMQEKKNASLNKAIELAEYYRGETIKLRQDRAIYFDKEIPTHPKPIKDVLYKHVGSQWEEGKKSYLKKK